MKSTPDNGMANLIRRRFRASGWSILQLAKRANIPYAGAYGFVHGDRDVALSTAARICKALGLVLRPRKGK